MGKQNDKQIISNTLTIVVGWNSDTISLYINTYSNFNFLKHPFRQGFQPFCICCMHMGKRYDKPTIPNTLTMVGGWNSDTISLYINTYLNFNFRQGCEPFCICFTHMGKRNDKPTIPNTLTIVGGGNSVTISLYLNTFFSPFPSLPPLNRICCKHMGKRYDKPTIPNTLTMVGGWNSDTISLYINTYLNFNFRQGFEPFCICCKHMGKRNDKPTIPNTLTIVVGWNSDTISLYINTYSQFLKHPFRQGFQPFCICCMHMGKRNDKPTIPNTLTMVGGWNSDTISLYINTYLNFNFRQRCEPFCICFTHMGKLNDKLTIPNTLTIVRGWKSVIISRYLKQMFLPFPCTPSDKGLNRFAFVVSTWVNKTTNK